MDDLEEPEAPRKTDDVDLVTLDVGDKDTVYWVYWPSLIQPGLRYMIGWPMKLNGEQHRGDH